MSQMFLNVVSTFKGDGIQSATRQLGAFGKSAGGLGSVLGKVGGALASFGIAAKAVQFGRESITAARDLERNLYALNTVFDDLAPGMVEFSKNAVNIGLSQSKAAKASVFIGSVLKQSGFEMSVVAKETQNLVALGTDLAALYGYDVQEALLGMTALFRGEYDPIEKFGVAMKQSEINAELAARGQNKLEGAARRNAEQTIRLELLYQRAADAMGAFTGQSGSLYTEQKKLGATFENVQATLGTALLPSIVDVNTELRKLLEESTPFLITVFEGLAQVIEGLIGIFRDAIDPQTELGESFAALGIQIESLMETLFGEDFDIASIFEIASAALGMFIDFMHDLLRVVEHTAIGFGVIGEQLGALFSSDWDKFFNTDWNKKIKDTIALSDATKDFRLEAARTSPAIKNLRDQVAAADRAKLDNLKKSLFGIQMSASAAAGEINRMRRQAGLPAIGAPGAGATAGADTGTETGGTGGGAAKKVVGLVGSLKKQAKVAKKVGKLIGMGLSEGLAEKIASGAKPIKAANKVIKKINATGGKFAKKLQKLYNKTPAGTSELERIANESARAAEEAQRQAEEYAQEQQELQDDIAEQARRAAEEAQEIAEEQARELARIREEEARAEAEALAERERVYNSFLDSVKQTFAGIRDSILGAFDITQLGGSTNSIIRNMKKLLETTKSFSQNIQKLATMGLNPTLLAQVIQAGPMAGARLAASLVAGGAAGIGQISAGYAEFENIASTIATTGTESRFGTAQQQNIYNIEVSGGVGSGATIGRAIVDAIKAYERTSGAVWVGA
jgi:hypothetical protein